jgi:predicted DNA-binding transcriptional regulator YafY
MRADRLLSILMMMQVRGRLTARQLATELEVSERTIYRDMLALDTAGVPVCSETGPNGGFSLIESYRTSLTGLSSDEAQALFMLSVPEAFTDLGLSGELKGALFKLAAALPERLRRDEAHVRERFHLDASWWQDDAHAVPHLKTVHSAVWDDCDIEIKFVPVGSVQMDLVVSPYALVSKAGLWYLVYENAGRMRVIAIARLLDVQLMETQFERNSNFDLEMFWKAWCETQQENRRQFHAHVRVYPPMQPYIAMIFGESVRRQLERNPTMVDGTIDIELRFESQIEARSRLLGFGSAIKVLAPESLRLSIRDLAEQVVQMYSNG